MLRMRLAIVLALILVPAAAHGTPQSRPGVQAWIEAVRAHAPGESDAAVDLVSACGRRDLSELLRQLRAQASGSEALSSEMPRLLARAAVLHMDVAILASSRTINLTATDRLVMKTRDGRGFGNAAAEPGWGFGRELLEGIAIDSEWGAFVRLWYRAAAAQIAQFGQLGELNAHLAEARRRLPNDGWTWFDTGWLYEEFAAPRSQAIVDEFAPSPSARVVSRLDVPPIGDALKQSEEAYSRALAVAPGMVEARIRRGRVRTLRGRTVEAVADLRVAVETAADASSRYFAALFLGGAYEARDTIEPARAAYLRAAATFPFAQSPRLALSRLAVRVGDMPTAQREIQHLLRMPVDQPDRGDPWWLYAQGSGNRADALVEKVRAALKANGKVAP